MTEEYFQKTFLLAIYDEVKAIVGGLGSTFVDSTQWDSIVVKMHNSVVFVIKSNMFRDTTTKVRGDDIKTYTLRNELSKVEFKASLLFS